MKPDDDDDLNYYDDEESRISMMTMRRNLNDDDYQVSGAMRRHGVDCGSLARGVKVSLTEDHLFVFLILILDN